MSHQADDTNGAVSACADADLGDVRRTTRLVELAGVLAQHPTAAFPEACGEGARRTAADRGLANAALAPQDCRASHLAATSRRLHHVPLVLAGQETTAVDWTSHLATQGLGPLGHTARQGRLVHRTLACTPERVPLGLVAHHGWARDPEAVGQRTRRQPLPIRQQASQPWLTSLEAVGRAHEGWPQTRLVSGGDRAAEVDDLLAAERPAGVAWVLRAAWDRAVRAPERDVWATVEAPPVVEPLRWQVPRRGPPPGRDATLALRCCPWTRRPPRHRPAEGWPAVALWAVQVRAIAPPDGVEPIEWRLLTTVAVPTGADAIERVEWYACRGGLEVWPRMLTSGGRIEARPLATGERWPRCVMRSSLMAWRGLYATLLARAVPAMPCRVLVAIAAWPALSCAIHHGPTPPERPPSLGQAVRWMAPLGGCVGRRRRDQPGAETLWRGCQHVTDFTSMSRMMRSAPPYMSKCVYLPARRERGNSTSRCWG
jgi:Transposase DNA-binding/Transposase Tn5 dimerisation domain